MVVLMMVLMWRATRIVTTTAVVLALMTAAVPGQATRDEPEVVEIVAERFTFTPSEIRVVVGTTLELRVRSDDTMHGFRIVGRNVNLEVPKRRQGEAVVLFEATEVGRYRFECSRLCGAGHNFMRGEIVVVDHDE
jgi:cytochrome c oxidase subunit 2